METLDAASRQVMRAAIDQGIVDPLFTVFDFDSRLYDWLARARANSQKPNPLQANLAYHPWSRRYQDHSFDLVRAPESELGWSSMLVELSRINVPTGNIGFLRRIEQYVGDMARYKATYDWLAIPSQLLNWGIWEYAEPEIDDIRWYLRLVPFYGPESERLFVPNITNPVPRLPGRPYQEPQLNEINCISFPCHNPYTLWAMIPGGYSLRFYVWTPATTTYQWTVRGKLSAITQALDSHEAELNARFGWNG